MKDTIRAFGSLFADNNKNKHAGLSLIHRHFLLKDGEKKVALQDDDNQILIIKATQASEFTDEKTLLPYLFQVAEKDGKPTLIPLEYVLHCKKERSDLLEQQLKAISDDSKFLKLSKKLPGSRLFGIFLPSRDFFYPKRV